MDPWRDPRGELAQVLDLLRIEMERAQSLTREFQEIVKQYKQANGDRSKEIERQSEIAA